MENNQLSSRVEAYFAALEMPLAELPASRREEFMAEARAHLHAMVEARRADGLDEAAAWDAALSEFGEPGEVGRALWKAWASSGQLESEGAPLSKAKFARKIALQMLAGAAIALFAEIQHKIFPAFSHISGNALFMALGLLCFFGFRAYQMKQRNELQLPHRVFGFVVGALLLFWMMLRNPPVNLIPNSPFLDVWEVPIMIGALICWLWLYKRDMARRPWRFGGFAGRYGQSPVAAEQEYRLYPVVGLAMGVIMGCVGLVVGGAEFFGLPLALFGCAGVIGVATAFGLWLHK